MDLINIDYNLLENLKYPKNHSHISTTKISIIGCNKVGIACAVALMYCKLNIEICLIDPYDIDRTNAEKLDLEHCAPPGIQITYGYDIEDTVGSNVCIMCLDKAAHDGKVKAAHDGKSTFEYFTLPYTIANVKYNADEYKRIIPIIVKKSPNTIFLIAAHPNAFMSYITWISSKLPINRIIGIGKSIETIKFRNLIRKQFNIQSNMITGYVIGIMKYNLPLYSDVDIAGTSLIDINNIDINFYSYYNNLFKKIRTRQYETKGQPEFLIATVLAKLTKAILTDSHEIYSVSTKNKGYFGMKKNIFISLPCSIGRNGVYSIIKKSITKYEADQILKISNDVYDNVYTKLL